MRGSVAITRRANRMRDSLFVAALGLMVAPPAANPANPLSAWPPPAPSRLEFQVPAAQLPFDLAAYRRAAWEHAGRPWLERYAGLKWNATSAKWELDQTWQFG